MTWMLSFYAVAAFVAATAIGMVAVFLCSVRKQWPDCGFNVRKDGES